MTRLTAPNAATASPPTDRRGWQVLAVTSVAVFMSFLDVTIVNIAFPGIRAEFAGSSLATLSWVLNGYGIVFAAALVPAGRWADRVGRRRAFVSGVVVFLVTSAGCGLAPGPAVLIGARLVQALGAAVLVPSSLALLLPEFPPSRRASATAIWGATGAVAAATGPSLGGVLVEWADWRLVFLVNLPIGLGALVAARRVLRANATTPGMPLPDPVSAVLLAAGIGVLALGIVQGGDWGWTGPGVLGCAVAAPALLAAFALRNARTPVPVVEPALFRVRSFAVATAGLFVFSIGFYAVLLSNVLFLTGAWGYSILRAGFALTPGPLMAAATAVVGGRLADRLGQRAIAIPGGLLFAAGAGWLAVAVPATPHYAASFLPAVLLSGAGVGLSISSFGSAAVAELPRSRYATGSAISACARQLGAVIGIAVLLAIVGGTRAADGDGAFRAAWWVMAGTGLAAAACAVALGRVRAVDVDLPGVGGPASTLPAPA